MRRTIIGTGLAIAAMGSMLTQMVRPRPPTRRQVEGLVDDFMPRFMNRDGSELEAIAKAQAKRERKNAKRRRIAEQYGMTPAQMDTIEQAEITTNMPPPNPVAEAVHGRRSVKTIIGATRKLDRSPEAMARKVKSDKITKQAKRDFAKGDEPRYYQNADEQAMYDKAWAKLKERTREPDSS